MTFIQPLDLQNILVNYLSGSMEIFMFLAFIVVCILAAKLRMPNSVALVMFALLAVFLANYYQGIFFLVILISGVAVFWGIGSLIKR